MNPSLRILLIDDHHLFRSGLKFLLADLQNNLEFFEAGTCAAALEVCNGAPDLVLLDYHLPDSPGGFTALTMLKERFDAATFVVLSSEDDPNIVIGAIEAGAAGFIPKSSTPDIMIAALKLILAGGTYIPSNALQSTARTKRFVAASDSAMSNGAPASAAVTTDTISAQLSERQLQVLIGAIRGKPNKVIARELDIAEGTVKAHLSVAFRVLDVRNRTEAVFMAAKFGIKI